MDRFITQIGQSRAILAFIMIIGIIIGYINYYGSEPAVIPDDTLLPQRKGGIESLADFNVDFSILDNKVYKSLGIFGENPVNPDIAGERRNPFLPL